ncbi:MAG: glycosyltransferase [Gallionella sp.]
MSIIHFSTELTGGAGAFAKSIHLAMQRLGYASFIVTRESNSLSNSVIIKPLTRLERSLRVRRLALMHRLGLIENKYALFGIENARIDCSDILKSVGNSKPTVLVFYWVSYFINFKCIAELRRTYPGIPFLFVCLDEGFLGGGCHYSWGCRGYEEACVNCPSTSLHLRKRKIQIEMQERIREIHKINPIVLYPTAAMARMGERSAILKQFQKEVIPLGAVSKQEQDECLALGEGGSKESGAIKQKLTILVRSSSEYRKGSDLFVGAIKLLAAGNPNIRSQLRVISIGDATLENSEIGNYVDHEFMGIVQRSQLMEIYGKIDALVVTSREDAGPLMINECVALGKFAISTPVGVANDLLADACHGIVVGAFTSEAICDALKSYCLQPREVVSTSELDRNRLTFEGYVGAMLEVIEKSQMIVEESLVCMGTANGAAGDHLGEVQR